MRENRKKDWRYYENEIFDYFKTQYSDLEVTKNAVIKRKILPGK